MKLSNVPKFPSTNYEVTVPWSDLEWHLDRKDRAASTPIILEPDYQRGHVWSDAQRSAYVEYALMGGESSMVITTNCPGWMQDFRGPYEVVDGLQRVTAARKFLKNEVTAFGLYLSQFEDDLNLNFPAFRWRVLSLPTRKEVLKLYLLLNAGGVVHSPAEIERVRALLESE